MTLHSPGTEKIITSDWIDNAHNGQIIINTARANLIDENSLASGLRSGKIAFFAADSISTEVSGGDSPLFATDLTDKTLFTPHIGGQTDSSVDLMGSMAVENVLAFLAGKQLRNQIKLPLTLTIALFVHSKFTILDKSKVLAVASIPHLGF